MGWARTHCSAACCPSPPTRASHPPRLENPGKAFLEDSSQSRNLEPIPETMKYITPLILSALLAVGASARADILELKNGNVLNGKYNGGTAGTVRFDAGAGMQVIETSQVIALTFTTAAAAPAAPAAYAPAPVPAPVAAPSCGDAAVRHNVPGAHDGQRLLPQRARSQLHHQAGVQPRRRRRGRGPGRHSHLRQSPKLYAGQTGHRQIHARPPAGPDGRRGQPHPDCHQRLPGGGRSLDQKKQRAALLAAPPSARSRAMPARARLLAPRPVSSRRDRRSPFLRARCWSSRSPNPSPFAPPTNH